jgi:16S rRNA (cytosine967-C5)-methyltransferase
LRRKQPRAISLDLLNRVEESDRHLMIFSVIPSSDIGISPSRSSLPYRIDLWCPQVERRLDWIIQHFSKIPFEKIESEMLNTLRLGLYQIFFLTKTPASAAVNESVELSQKDSRERRRRVSSMLSSAAR